MPPSGATGPGRTGGNSPAGRWSPAKAGRTPCAGKVGELLDTVEWDYPEFHLTMHCFLCTLDGEAPHLNEHEAARWLSAGELRSVNWLPADYGLLPKLAEHL